MGFELGVKFIFTSIAADRIWNDNKIINILKLKRSDIYSSLRNTDMDMGRIERCPKEGSLLRRDECHSSSNLLKMSNDMS